MRSTEARWIGLEQASVETFRLDEDAGGVRLSGAIDRGALRVEYVIEATAAWEFRALTLGSGGADAGAGAVGPGSTAVRSVAFDGHDWRIDGVVRPELAAAREVDLALSPVSNTLPIRRLGLEVGESREIVTAYVAAGLDSVVADPQRYTRIAERRWLYESLDSPFRREITVDEHGLVVDYPALFRRG